MPWVIISKREMRSDKKIKLIQIEEDDSARRLNHPRASTGVPLAASNFQYESQLKSSFTIM